ncbi:hypothetical protein FRB94_006538 [Tulasnella sp. JGI-2019a]|nr:hypothetical protein FRB93_012122 [Tulasnella sp. JGI-2019a]KAG9012170.1 hypothetical protein FRB94_006538 [Tulasnella sp. JGI-2019a]
MGKKKSKTARAQEKSQVDPDVIFLYIENPYGMGPGANLSKGGQPLNDISNWIHRMVGDAKAHGLDNAPDRLWAHTQRTEIFLPIDIQGRDEDKVRYLLGEHLWTRFCDASNSHVVQKLGGHEGFNQSSTVYIATMQSEQALGSAQWTEVKLDPKAEPYADFLGTYPRPRLPSHPIPGRGFGRSLPVAIPSPHKDEKHHKPHTEQEGGQSSWALSSALQLDDKPEQKSMAKREILERELKDLMVPPTEMHSTPPDADPRVESHGASCIKGEAKPTMEQLNQLMVEPMTMHKDQPETDVEMKQEYTSNVKEGIKPATEKLEHLIPGSIVGEIGQPGVRIKVDSVNMVGEKAEAKPTKEELAQWMVEPTTMRNTQPDMVANSEPESVRRPPFPSTSSAFPASVKSEPQGQHFPPGTVSISGVSVKSEPTWPLKDEDQRSPRAVPLTTSMEGPAVHFTRGHSQSTTRGGTLPDLDFVPRLDYPSYTHNVSTLQPKRKSIKAPDPYVTRAKRFKHEDRETG